VKLLQILIPMAGAGSRFSSAGYHLPKPLVDVAGLPMIGRVIDNLGTNHHYWFVVQKGVWAEYSVELTRVANMCDHHTFLLVDGVTEGAAQTCLVAERMLDPEQSVMIANCDQIQNWQPHHFHDWFEKTPSDGTIITFNSDSTKNSYVTVDEQGWVTQAREKEVISNLATTGVYVWRKAKNFVKAAHQMINSNTRVNNEFYVCPIYNFNIEMGHQINTYHIDQHWPTGTPEDLNIYLQHLNQENNS
jgi:UDP-N-acetylglucosamine diphosphorylase / glucose-1-phosphate thymidylyltransferase / UDP-N-acetylgalactosamine diphosphorylase / glucosamine-1-phosphate N-acetyltransferase / galactosamine-1-phosphate N-acetyltransferase